MRKLLVLLVFCACDDPALVVVDDAYPVGTSVDMTWWHEMLVVDEVASGAESFAYRVVAGSDYAYALLRRDGVPIVVRSKDRLSVEMGETLHVRLAPDAVVGDCATGAPLSQAEADLVTQSIFPEPFAGAIYDAATCKTFKP